MREIFGKIWIYFGTCGLVVFDQIVKLFVVRNIGRMPVSVIRGLLRFSYCENEGVAFSIGDGNVPFFIVLNFVIICGLIVFYERNKKEFGLFGKVGFMMAVAGGISNLLDRVFRGFVVDFIDVSELFSFAIFNVADVFIVAGVVGIAFSILKKNKFT